MTEPAAGVPAVVAAVMTYNRRESLRECLRAIQAQTSPPTKVVVVDNASSDGTAEMLAAEFPGVEVRRTSENVGCAGAMAVALDAALAYRPEYIWLFDDDAIPTPSALERLCTEMKALERDLRMGALRPTVKDPRTGEVMGGGVSHGALLRAEMVAAVGPPPTELFIELSDHAYNVMIRKAGYEILRVPTVLAQHPVSRPKPLRDLLTHGYRAKPWRLYYGVRNRVYFSLYVYKSVRDLLRNLAVAASAVFLLTALGRPRRGQTLVLRGVVDGVLGRLGRRVSPDY